MSVKKLKKVREDSGYTVRSLAKKIGVNMSSISYWENGIKNPKESNRLKLQNELGVSHIELFKDEDTEESGEYLNGNWLCRN